MSILLEAEGLSCARAGRTIVAGLTVTLRAGEALVLRGPNGAGKTTALRTLAGLGAVSSGRLTIGGGDAAKDGDGARAKAHYLGDRDPLKPTMTVRETASFFARLLSEQDPKDGADRALERVGLTAIADLPCAILSTGQRKRLALSRLFAAPRQLWLLDEPTNGLDDAAQSRLADAIAEHRADGGAIALAAHGRLAREDAPQGARFLTIGAA